jgi:hypothetical protein
MKWVKDWQMKCNVTKCNILRLGNNPPPFAYTTISGNTTIPHKEIAEAIDLGIIIRTDLKTSSHTNHI